MLDTPIAESARAASGHAPEPRDELPPPHPSSPSLIGGAYRGPRSVGTAPLPFRFRSSSGRRAYCPQAAAPARLAMNSRRRIGQVQEFPTCKTHRPFHFLWKAAVPRVRGDYLTRRHKVAPIAPPLIFSSSPVRLMDSFGSVPSTFGNSAPSNFRVNVLSTSLTDHVPKLATSPCATAL
jgi:hypothetical protein